MPKCLILVEVSEMLGLRYESFLPLSYVVLNFDYGFSERSLSLSSEERRKLLGRGMEPEGHVIDGPQLVEKMLSASLCMEEQIYLNSGQHLAKYKNLENLNAIKSHTSKSEEKMLLVGIIPKVSNLTSSLTLQKCINLTSEKNFSFL